MGNVVWLDGSRWVYMHLVLMWIRGRNTRANEIYIYIHRIWIATSRARVYRQMRRATWHWDITTNIISIYINNYYYILWYNMKLEMKDPGVCSIFNFHFNLSLFIINIIHSNYLSPCIYTFLILFFSCSKFTSVKRSNLYPCKTWRLLCTF